MSADPCYFCSESDSSTFCPWQIIRNGFSYRWTHSTSIENIKHTILDIFVLDFLQLSDALKYINRGQWATLRYEPCRHHQRLAGTPEIYVSAHITEHAVNVVLLDGADMLFIFLHPESSVMLQRSWRFISFRWIGFFCALELVITLQKHAESDLIKYRRVQFNMLILTFYKLISRQ